MKQTIMFLLFASCALAVLPPEVFIDLDQRPEHRWVDALTEVVKDPIKVANIAGFFPGVDQLYAYAGCDATCYAILATAYQAHFPVYYRELSGIVSVLSAAGIPITVEKLAAYQYIVEIFHAVPGFKRSLRYDMGCTSIITCDKTGKILHGRNLDFTTPSVFRNMTVRARFQRHGEVLFESSQFVIEAGVTTGVRRDHFSISYNWRSQLLPIADVLSCVTNEDSIAPLSAGMRDLLEHSPSYSRAVSRLSVGRLCSPMYISLASPENKGVHLTKEGTQSLFPQVLDCAANASKWYIAQTNYDNGVSPAFDNRLGLATGALDAMTQYLGSTFQGLFNVLSIPPTSTSRGVLNELTVYTTIMSPTEGTNPTELRST